MDGGEEVVDAGGEALLLRRRNHAAGVESIANLLGAQSSQGWEHAVEGDRRALAAVQLAGAARGQPLVHRGKEVAVEVAVKDVALRYPKLLQNPRRSSPQRSAQACSGPARKYRWGAQRATASTATVTCEMFRGNLSSLNGDIGKWNIQIYTTYHTMHASSPTHASAIKTQV